MSISSARAAGRSRSTRTACARDPVGRALLHRGARSEQRIVLRAERELHGSRPRRLREIHYSMGRAPLKESPANVRAGISGLSSSTATFRRTSRRRRARTSPPWPTASAAARNGRTAVLPGTSAAGLAYLALNTGPPALLGRAPQRRSTTPSTHARRPREYRLRPVPRDTRRPFLPPAMPQLHCPTSPLRATYSCTSAGAERARKASLRCDLQLSVSSARHRRQFSRALGLCSGA